MYRSAGGRAAVIDTTETYLPVVDRGRVKESVERITWFGADKADA
jgi:hypothetical protein